MAIVPVAKVTLYGTADQKDAVLDGLQELGCLHLLDVNESRERQSQGKLSSPDAAEALKYLPRSIKKESEDPLVPEMNGRPLRELLDNFESAILQREFSRCDGNVTKLAAHLKVDRANLHRKLKQLGVK